MIKRSIYNLLKVLYKTTLTKKSIVLTKHLLSTNPFARTYCTDKTKRCSTDIFNKNYQYSRIGKDTPVCCSTHLYELLRDVTLCLQHNSIEYFIFYGTYLGAIRHDGLIPWDTDIDLCIMEEHKQASIKALRDYCSSNKYPLTIIDNDLLMIDFSEKNKLHIDVYFMQTNKQKIYLNGYEQFQYSITSIFPLKTLPFYDLQVLAPNSLTPLHIRYGEDCLNKSFHQHSFISQRTINTFLPAKIDPEYLRK